MRRVQEVGGEAALKLPDLSQVQFLGIDGHKLLLFGILFCIFGLIFGLVIYSRLKNLPVHKSMRDISELIYETCKTYLATQGKFQTDEFRRRCRVLLEDEIFLKSAPGAPCLAGLRRMADSLEPIEESVEALHANAAARAFPLA